ncbi:carboxypeptidase-like regulatory domain-containing protein [Longimicrobium sp.]|uniref:carboxypeptidase-like regulatory domain-containing protein n=1 Tax=Longimicrobium sp. TaxID=2029185 RepID=UPI002C88D558|nr:carboxypeptidase-like regulatory domain-containing protein [Longimicrobium sp.]HSU16334.1 carboxypeptidase-like regulatory domain-containing protein [Longimicrobium sp.]
MNASPWHRIACAAAVAVVALAAAPLAAQRVTVSGQVTDADSGQPVAGALVRVGDDDHEVMSDAQGRFTLFRVPVGDRVVWGSAMGYGTSAATVAVAAGGASGVALPLKRDPVRLAAINATVSRFESRRRSYGSSVRLLTERDLAASASSDMRDFLEVRAGLHRLPCSGSGGGLTRNDCVIVRGRAAVPVVYVDEVRWGVGLDVLSTYRPEDVARVEVYGGGAQVRVYTRWFLDWASRNNTSPGRSSRASEPNPPRGWRSPADVILRPATPQAFFTQAVAGRRIYNRLARQPVSRVECSP